MEKYCKSKIVFIAPSFNSSLKKIEGEVKKYFNADEYILLVVNDGSTKEIFIPEEAVSIHHSENKGLAHALLSGYKEAIKYSADIVIKVDPDGEYPLYPLRELVDRVRGSNGVVGGFIGTKRTICTYGIFDVIFNNIMGRIEGFLIFGRAIIQHSPGLLVFKVETLKNILPELERITLRLNLRWGLDLVSIKLFAMHGGVDYIDIHDHAWGQRRPLKKIFSQTITAIRVLRFMRA